MAENLEKQSGRGGARPGAGRKKTGRLKQFVTTSVSGTPEEIARLKEAAKAAGKTVSRFVLDSLVPPPDGAISGRS